MKLQLYLLAMVLLSALMVPMSIGTYLVYSSSDDDDDCDYLPGDLESSEDDEEACEIKKQFKAFKKKYKAGEIPNLDDMYFGAWHKWFGRGYQSDFPEAIEDNGNETPYYDTSENEDSFDKEDNGCELVRKNSVHPKFDSRAQVPNFSLGMRFATKQEFKEAVRRYGLAERRTIKFVKDEGYRVRAQCTVH